MEKKKRKKNVHQKTEIAYCKLNDFKQNEMGMDSGEGNTMLLSSLVTCS